MKPNKVAVFQILLILIALPFFLVLEMMFFYYFPEPLNLLLGNFIVSVLFGYLSWFAIPKYLQSNKWSLIALFVVFGMFIPVLGVFGIGVAIIASHWLKVRVSQTEIKTMHITEYSKVKTAENSGIDLSDTENIIYNEKIPIAVRLKELSKLNIAHSSTSNIVNREMLYAKNDELRLYAFGVLDSQETLINSGISKTLLILEKTNSQIHKAKLEKHLAFLYWLFIDLRLAQKDLFDFILNTTLTYALSAVKILEDDASLWVLLGRIYTLQNDRVKSFDALNRATRLKAADDSVFPYLLEWSFRKRNFGELRGYLEMSNILQNIPMMNEIAEFWCK